MATAARRRVRWLQLEASCSCGARLADFIPATERVHYLGRAPTAVVRRTRCRARGCGSLVEITAAAYIEAGEKVDRQKAAS